MSEDLVAFTLREEYVGTVVQKEHEDDPGVEVPAFTGGIIHAGNDRDLDVAEALTEDGVIVVDLADTQAVAALDSYPPLKRTTVPGNHTILFSEPEATPYGQRKVGDLRADADTRGIEGASSAVKDDLIVALSEHDRRLADGGLDELGSPLTVEALVAAGNANEGGQ